MSETRDSDITKRSLAAKYWTQYYSKLRRNVDRKYIIVDKAAKVGILIGKHFSWGADGSAFDEYFGALNTKNLPHGIGVKFYSDGSVYVGGWKGGVQHNSDNSTGKVRLKGQG